jgi:hypothetical protein
MKTIITLSLLPLIILAYFLSAKLYVAADYLSAYAMVALFFSAVVVFCYRAGASLQAKTVRA